MDERKVKRIYHPPAIPAADLFKGGKQRRVAAYARVSTASDEQLNTVDTLNTIRQLKAANVEVFFEKENIYTMDSKGEFLITLLSSIAEEESRSISENGKWGQRKRFADGKYSVPYKHFLGYRRGADGSMEIVPEEAKVVRWIYHRASPHNGARRFSQCFDPSESMENAGILDVFPIFHTERLGQKIR